MENTNRDIRRNVILFYIVTTGYALACSFLTEGYIQAYLMDIGLDTMAIGVYGTCSQAAALLGYVLFLMYRPKERTGYVRGILRFGLPPCLLPVALILAGRFPVWILYAGVALYQISTAMKASCEYSATPVLFPRARYGRITAQCGIIGAGLAALLSAVSAMLADGGAARLFSVSFAMALAGLLAASLPAALYRPIGSLEQAEADGGAR
ncbi:MAG: hypothetical protein J5998_00675, partial [Clostridia bacterium]|nr:hypothetical protein [Clostridia bacterium]